MSQHLTIDWREAEALVGGNGQAARELMALFVQRLPDDLQQMEVMWQKKDREGLGQLVHRFYGGLCYCGVPHLRKVTARLKVLCQHGDELAITQQMVLLQQAVDQVLQAYRSNG